MNRYNHLNDKFQIIQWQKDSRELKATCIRMEQMNVLDIAFLYGCAQPTIAFIHQSNNGRHVQTYEINLQEKEFVKGTSFTCDYWTKF